MPIERNWYPSATGHGSKAELSPSHRRDENAPRARYRLMTLLLAAPQGFVAERRPGHPHRGAGDRRNTDRPSMSAMRSVHNRFVVERLEEDGGGIHRRTAAEAPRRRARHLSPLTACRIRACRSPSAASLLLSRYATCRTASRRSMSRPSGVTRHGREIMLIDYTRPSRSRRAPWASFRLALSRLIETVADAEAVCAYLTHRASPTSRKPRCRLTTPQEIVSAYFAQHAFRYIARSASRRLSCRDRKQTGRDKSGRSACRHRALVIPAHRTPRTPCGLVEVAKRRSASHASHADPAQPATSTGAMLGNVRNGRPVRGRFGAKKCCPSMK